MYIAELYFVWLYINRKVRSVMATFSRDLLRGSLDVVLLSELERGPKYGYQILSSIRERSGGRIDLKAGTLYPLLHRLEADGLIASRWEQGSGRDRKWYELTERGRVRLAADAREWLDYAACIRGLLAPALGSVPHPDPAEAG